MVFCERGLSILLPQPLAVPGTRGLRVSDELFRASSKYGSGSVMEFGESTLWSHSVYYEI